jgi:CheY-like chemotaxis protein
MHLLIADDSHDNADVLAKLLAGERGENTVDVAYDGAQAVAAARLHPPDAALLDIEMPILGGVDAAQAIRLAMAGNPPFLIAMTGNPDSVEAGRASGVFSHVLAKPVDLVALTAFLVAAHKNRQ